MYKAKIFISLREGIKNSEGEAIQKSLHSLGYTEVSKFNISKYMTLNIDTESFNHATTQVKGMCDKLLANTVIEDYSYTLEYLDK